MIRTTESIKIVIIIALIGFMATLILSLIYQDHTAIHKAIDEITKSNNASLKDYRDALSIHKLHAEGLVREIIFLKYSLLATLFSILLMLIFNARKIFFKNLSLHR